MITDMGGTRPSSVCHDSEKEIRSFFLRIAEGDSGLLHKISDWPSFVLSEHQWRFRLPDLFEFLQQHVESFTPLDYLSFRRQLYRCPLNADLAELNCRLVIVDNRRQVDRSVYALEWSSARKESE